MRDQDHSFLIPLLKNMFNDYVLPQRNKNENEWMDEIFLILFLSLLKIPLVLSAADHPNFLIILADDCTYNDLPLMAVKMQRPLTSISWQLKV